MARSAASARLRQRIADTCESVADARTLRLRILEDIRPAIGFDAYAWLLTDPQTSVGSAPLAEVPCLPELPRLIRLKYLTEVNRWTTLRRNPVALLREATEGDLSRSLLWRGLLSRYGVTDMASVVFRDRFGCWGFLDLWRSGSSAPFGGADAAADSSDRPVPALANSAGGRSAAHSGQLLQRGRAAAGGRGRPRS